MKYLNALAVSSIVVCLAGCASAPKVVLQDPVGPCHRVSAEGAKDGSLQVYSARELAPIHINAEEFFCRDEFPYGSGHTDYTILAQDGTVFKHVRNRQGINPETPVLVALPPGHYTIEAEAEAPGATTFTVVVPLVVEAGQTTAIHLEPMWKASGEILDPNRVVWLADGRIIGCRAERLLSQNTQSASATRPGMALTQSQ